MEKLMRSFFLFLSKNRFLMKMAKKYGLRLGASRFVAGETVEETIEVIKELNQRGLVVTIDYLGEFTDNEKEAIETANQLIEAIKAIRRANLNAQLSLKLTSLGLDLSEEVVTKNMYRVLEAANENQVFVTIDMEDFQRCQKTIDLFKKLRNEYDNVGTVIQAYLYRSEQDLNELNAPLRLVKGAYKESAEVAFPLKSDVDKNLKKLIEQHLLNGNFTAVASHDENIIAYTKNFVNKNKIPSSQFEFQMLYGIRTERQYELVEEGYTMRVYVPFGTDWYGYFMRRLAERPANVLFVIKGIV
jgi:proline dehydrogenase